MDLACARDQVATELTRHIPGRVYPHRPNVVRVGDGWLVLRRLEPATFASCTASFDVLLALGTEEQAAQESLDDLAVTLIDGIGRIGATPTGLTPVSLNIDGSDLYCAAASLLINVED